MCTQKAFINGGLERGGEENAELFSVELVERDFESLLCTVQYSPVGGHSQNRIVITSHS